MSDLQTLVPCTFVQLTLEGRGTCFKEERNDFQYFTCLFLNLPAWSYSVQKSQMLPTHDLGPFWGAFR